jgi:hypothetical protein
MTALISGGSASRDLPTLVGLPIKTPIRPIGSAGPSGIGAVFNAGRSTCPRASAMLALSLISPVSSEFLPPCGGVIADQEIQAWRASDRPLAGLLAPRGLL